MKKNVVYLLTVFIVLFVSIVQAAGSDDLPMTTSRTVGRIGSPKKAPKKSVVGGLSYNVSEIYGSNLYDFGGYLATFSGSVGYGISINRSFEEFSIKSKKSQDGSSAIKKGGVLTFGGLDFRTIGSKNSLFCMSFNSVIGVGSLTFDETIETGTPSWQSNINPTELEDKILYVINPGTDMYINLSEFIRVGAGVSYRSFFTQKFKYLNDRGISSTSYRLGVEFGYYR
jgi:hypothetical protein